MAIVAAGIITALIITLLSITLPAMMGQLLGHVLYNIGKLILDLADFMQMIFRRLAGLDVYWFKDGKSYYHNLSDSLVGGYDTTGSDFSVIEHDVINNSQQEGDILLKLFSSNAVVEALIAMTLFAVALLLIVTIIQIIRVEYTTEGSKNSKGTIIGKALKSLAMFILVPVVCFLGVFVSNKLLAAVDSATAQSGSSTLSGYIFLAASADANVIRCGEADYMPDAVVLKKNDARFKANLNSSGNGLEGWKTTYFSSNKASAEARRADIANDIDQLFVSRYNAHGAEENTVVTISAAKDGTVSFKNIDKDKDTFVLHYSFVRGVEYFYNLLDINYLILYFGGFMTLLSLFRASFGLVLRLYKATALFIISPGVTALTPIDDGNAYKQWRKAFIANVLGAYGFVIAMNLLFLLLGIIDNIHLFDPNKFFSAAPNALVRAVMVIVGVNMLEDLAKQISGFIGGADILSEGKASSEKAGKTIGKIGSAVGGGVMMAGGLVGGIASRIYSGAAKKVLANKDGQKNKARMEELQKKKNSGAPLDQKETKELAKLEKANEKGEFDIDFEKAEKYRQRAAYGERARLRGSEVLKNTWEGSALGSFLNTATGGYIPAFGGKQIKNLDDKLYDGNEEVFNMAKKSDGGVVNKVLGKVGEWTLGLPGKGIDLLLNKTLPNTFGNIQEEFEANKSKHEIVESHRKYYHNEFTHEVETDEVDPTTGLKKTKRVMNEGDQLILDDYKNRDMARTTANNTIEAIKSTIAGLSGNAPADLATMKNLMSGISLEGLDNDSRNAVSALQSKIASVTDPNALKNVLKGFNVGELKAEKIDTEQELYARLIEGTMNYGENFKNHGFAATDDLAERMQAYEEYMRRRPKPAESPSNTGTSGGASKDMNIKAGNVKMDADKIDMKSDNTKIDDGNQIANKMAQTLDEAFKKANQQKDKDVKENRTYEMLEKIQKILKNVEKNTKKK